MDSNGKREIWVDNVKVVACILVVLGHFFQSMVKSSILPVTGIFMWFENTIYTFHVQLFFICSGYLYQRYSKVDSVKAWRDNILKKLLALGVPYFVFSTVTWGLKTVFSSTVNTYVGGVKRTLFIAPISPYWYLYCLFFMFVITPTFRGKRSAYIGLAAAICLKLLSVFKGGFGMPVVTYLLVYEIWFVAGMCISVFKINKWLVEIPGIFGAVVSVAFFISTVALPKLGLQSHGAYFIMGVMGCVSVLMVICRVFRSNVQNAAMGFMAKYTMPVFLMHTIFSAGLRSVLLKIGITNAGVHVIFGLLIGFIGPVIAAKVMSRFKCLDFLLYPNRYVKQRRKNEVK
jgi:fucose 4-O-acetylase-like acetyltransferase